MKKTIILLVLILINSCSSSKTSTQTNDQDKPVIEISKTSNTAPIKDKPIPKIVEKTKTRDDYLVASTTPKDIQKGKELFTTNTCTACHLDDGGGSIGPNLTDAYTISGCSFEDIFNTISDGGRPGKGMVSWKTYITKKEIQQLTSYIISLKGTTPKQPKHPEGELCSE